MYNVLFVYQLLMPSPPPPSVSSDGRRVAAAGAGGLQDPSPRLRSVAIATLGKLCLQHEQMAKRVVPALGKILDVTDEPAIKNNVVFTLSDMCVR